MSKLSNKHIVDKIQKLAQLQPWSPTGAPATPAAPGAAPAPTGSGGPRDVAKMQMELRNLATTVSSQVGAPKPGVPQTKQEKDEADSRLSFNNFIVEHYLRPAGGVEFDADPSQTQMADKNPNQPARMNMLVDTMSRVGGPSNEMSVDNNWGPRTNGALRDAYALAAGLMKMAKSFNFAPQQFTEADVGNFKDLIPYKATDITPQQKNERAQYLAPYIVGVRHLFDEVQRHILNKPAYRSYIEGQAYQTYKAQPTVQLTPQQVESLKQKFPNGFAVPVDPQGTHSAQFTVDDLVNTDSLNKKVESVNTQYQAKLDPYDTLTAISKQIGGGA